MRAWLKLRIKEALQRRGLRLTYDRDDSWSPDMNFLAILAEWRFGEEGPRTAVQIGANDGVADDPLRTVILRWRMKAVLLEPLPEPFAKLAATYANTPDVTPLRAALDASDGVRPIWRVRFPDGAGARFDSIASFHRGMVEKHHRRYSPLGGRLVQEDVRTISAPTLLREHTDGPIDILQIDAEGFDATVVRAFLDAGCRPALINFEHRHLAGSIDRECCQRLRDAGYRLIRYGQDTAAILPESPAAASSEAAPAAERLKAP